MYHVVPSFLKSYFLWTICKIIIFPSLSFGKLSLQAYDDCKVLADSKAEKTCIKLIQLLENKNNEKNWKKIDIDKTSFEYALNGKNCFELTNLDHQANCYALRIWKPINGLRDWYNQINSNLKYPIQFIKTDGTALPNYSSLQKFDHKSLNLDEFPYYYFPKQTLPKYLTKYFDQWQLAINSIRKDLQSASNFTQNTSNDKVKWNKFIYNEMPLFLPEKEEKFLQYRFKKIYEHVSENRIFHSGPFAHWEFDKLKNKNLRDFFCKNVPMGGILHLHTSGIPDRKMTKEIYQEENLFFDGAQIYSKIGEKDQLYSDENTIILKASSIQGHYNDLKFEQKDTLETLWALIDPGRVTNFSRFEASFTIQIPLYNHENAMFLIMDKFLQNLNPRQIQLVEFTEEFPLKQEIMGTLYEIKNTLEQKYNIKIHFQFPFYRDNSNEFLQSQLRNLLYLLGQSKREEITPFGINLIGREELFPTFSKANVLLHEIIHFNQTNGPYFIPMTLHAGEMKHADVSMSVRDALIISSGLTRIDHGISIFPDDVLTMMLAWILKVPFNISINSNLKLDRVNKIEEHPFLHMVRLFPTTLSPDDPGIFGNSMKDECMRAIDLGANLEDFKQMAINSIIYSHFSPSEKSHAYKIFSQNWVQFIDDFKKEFINTPGFSSIKSNAVSN